MKKNKTILIASGSMLAAGMAHGAIIYQYVNQSFLPSSSGYNLDLNGDGANDYRVFFDANNSSKPCVVGTFTGSGSSYPGSFPNPTGFVLNELNMNPVSPDSNENNGLPVIPFATNITSEITVGADTVTLGDPGGDKYGKNEGYLNVNGDQMQVGQWPAGQNTTGYVALALVDDSVTPANTNYGWLHLELDYTQPTATLTVIDYAYQDTGGSNILAGDTGLTYPVVLQAPTNQTVVAGSTVTLNVVAGGASPLAYQWMAGAVGGNIYTNLPNAGGFSGVTTPTLTISNVTPADQLDYVVAVTNFYGFTNSPPATLTVVGAGLAGPSPTQQVIYAGYPAHFTVTNLGGGVLTNSWQLNGTSLTDGGVYSGSTTTNLVISSVAPGNLGNYSATVSTAYGSVTSSVAPLGIVYPDGSPYEYAVRAFGAVDYYRLDETSGTAAWDFIGGNTGTYESNPTLGQPGPTPSAGFPGFAPTNYAAAFSDLDTNSFITLPPWNLNANTVTITAWIYPQLNQGNAGIVFTAGTGTNVYGIRYDGGYTNPGGINDGDIGYLWNNDPNDGLWDSGITAPHDEWSLVALAVSPTDATLYIINAEGTQSAVHTYNHDPATFNATEYIGTYPLEGALGNNNFNGFIDEVAIFKSTLSADQINALYQSALGQIVPPAVTIKLVPGGSQIRWTGGALLQSTNLLGPWVTNTAATSPYTIVPTGPQQFFRAIQ